MIFSLSFCNFHSYLIYPMFVRKKSSNYLVQFKKKSTGKQTSVQFLQPGEQMFWSFLLKSGGVKYYKFTVSACPHNRPLGQAEQKKKGFTVTNTNNNDPLHALAIIMTVGTFFTPVVRSGELWPSTYFLYNPLSIKASQLKCQHACTMSIKHARLWTIYGPLSLSSLHSQFT